MDAKWTVDTLKEHFEKILVEKDKAITAALAAAEKAVNAALVAAEKAVDKAEFNAEKWRDSANEWRGAMNDREKNFATKSEVQLLKERADLGQGKSTGLHYGWILLIGFMGVVATVISIFMVFKK